MSVDEEPTAKCDRCGRKTWDPGQVNGHCGMPQPDGTRCLGVMDPGNWSPYQPATGKGK